MSRPTVITREELLAAAREVFLERGVGATTCEIARRAGVSEGSVFRRWATKNELFVEAMGFPSPEPWLTWIAGRAGEGSVVENLRELATRLVEYFLDLLPRVIVVFGCGAQLSEFAHDWSEPPPLRAIRAITAYFAAERDLGRVRCADPEIVARTMLGAIHFYAFTEVTGLNRAQPLDASTFTVALVDQLVDGLSVACSEEG